MVKRTHGRVHLSQFRPSRLDDPLFVTQSQLHCGAKDGETIAWGTRNHRPEHMTYTSVHMRLPFNETRCVLFLYCIYHIVLDEDQSENVSFCVEMVCNCGDRRASVCCSPSPSPSSSPAHTFRQRITSRTPICCQLYISNGCPLFA